MSVKTSVSVRPYHGSSGTTHRVRYCSVSSATSSLAASLPDYLHPIVFQHACVMSDGSTQADAGLSYCHGAWAHRTRKACTDLVRKRG